MLEGKRKGRAVKNERSLSNLQYSLDYLFDHYYQARSAEGRAVNTLKTYQQNFRYFCEYLDMRGIPRDIRMLNAEVGRDYILWLRNEKRKFSDKCKVPESVKTVGLQPKSINTRLKNLKTMFKFLVEDGVIDTDPFANVKPVEDIGRDFEVLTVDELRDLLDAPNQRKYSDFRDYVVLNLLIDGMLRIDEALTFA